MYNSQTVADRIKKAAKDKNLKLKTMLSDLQLGINLISQIANGSSVTASNLSKIADYLDCSVDYLLGRTDNPNAHKKERPVLSIENEPRYRVRFAGRDGSIGEKYLTKEEIDALDASPDVEDL